jgi:hypothetical protein
VSLRPAVRYWLRVLVLGVVLGVLLFAGYLAMGMFG